MDSQTKGKVKRNHGPRADTLEDCKKAMVDWLDNGKPLSMSAVFVNRDDQTILNNIPYILDLTEPKKRDAWIKLIIAQGKERYLGKYRENKRE